MNIAREGARISMGHQFTHHQTLTYLTTNLNPKLLYLLSTVYFSLKKKKFERCTNRFAVLIKMFISVLLCFNSFSFGRLYQNSFDLGRLVVK